MSSHSECPVQGLVHGLASGLVSSSFTELIPSIGGTSSGLPSLPNYLSSGATSHGSDNGLEVQNTAIILCKKQEELQTYDKIYGHANTINILPDYALLEIFDACRKAHDSDETPFTPVWRWHGLVHVCRRWRHVVFGSPRRLDLQILCTNGTRVRENLDIWPPFPISIQYRCPETLTLHDKDSLFAALDHPGRICHLELTITGPQLGEAATILQEPLPALEHLTLNVNLLLEDESPSALPSRFLGGSAPRLRYMRLEGIPFPTLPTLLSSTSDLVDLHLDNIPEDGHLSPEAMAVCLAALPKLKFLQIGFLSELAASDDRIPLLPVPRAVLPALIFFQFQGDSVYLEEFTSRIDSPQLKWIDIKYYNEFLDFRVAQLLQFIDRSDTLEKTLIKYADVIFSGLWMAFEAYPFPESHADQYCIGASVYRLVIDRFVSDIDEVFYQPSKMLSHVVHLKLSRYPADLEAGYLAGDLPFLLSKFTTVRTLRVSQEFAKTVALALEDITEEMVAHVLPVLDLIYLAGQPVSCVEKFFAARRLSGHPVTIVDTEVEFEEKVKSY